MLEQTRLLFQLVDELDLGYLRRRAGKEYFSHELLTLLGAEALKIISLREKSLRISARKLALGGVTSERIARARNRGERRTPSKRALLAEITAEARRQGREPAISSLVRSTANALEAN
jgi:hypothetical protein